MHVLLPKSSRAQEGPIDWISKSNAQVTKPRSNSPNFLNTRFALGAPLLYVELVYFLRGGHSSFRGLGQYDTPLDAAWSQTEDRRKKFVQSRIFR